MGLFISLSSGISGKKRMEIEKYKKKTIIYLPNAGFNQFNIICCIIMIQEINRIKSINDININLNEKCNEIYQSLNNLKEIHEITSKFSFDIRKSKEIINKEMENLMNHSIEAEIKIKKLIQDIRNKISINLNEINSKIKIIDLENDELEKYLKNININKKIYLNMCILKHIVKSSLMNIGISDTKIYIFKNDKQVSEVKIQKTKVSIISKNPNVNIELHEKNENLIKMMFKAF